ncbi:DEAD/DEAH box helicase family protein [Alicyclobacillus mengziensis]|uniref:DEAD/DEAH box helicase family protein n=1 Tax=Alicyclobacillus mengziensis TaxID=2931921 RepID=A0A9X7Z9A8_9BACL|nr:DEAD/DEAH box helicase family protein [Alicyclobacillus mengziensis]QSO49291.1 DEAD/DEAH box helicase family protein [Alicyclobacillus mengziensis]
MIRPGLYEQIINRLIQRDLAELDEMEFYVERGPIDDAESTILLAQYMEQVLRVALDTTRGEDSLRKRVELCNQLIQMLAEKTADPYVNNLLIRSDAELLLALLKKQNSAMGVAKETDITGVRPQTSIAQSSLFTGARSEPSMVAELQREILTSDRIDMLVSFIKWSGLRLLLNELQQFTERGQLRIITTSYMGATDIKAIDALRGLPNTSIRVSYDTNRTRLHAKAYIFHRDTGFSTTYIGSSNISNAALSSGLEWNVKVAASDQPETYEKVAATFEGYWSDSEFTAYEDIQRPILVRALRAERYQGGSVGGSFVFDIRPYGFQKEILEKLDAERNVHGSHRNLIVAATGTGKTVVSAFDYKRFREAHRGMPNRLLFVAHREEILTQSRDCFRSVLHDENFGELFVGGLEPARLDHLFVSIQTLNSRNLPGATSSGFYDFVVVDEFHHAAARTYQQLLEYYAPNVLLGVL